jgi:hypothetical protein
MVSFPEVKDVVLQEIDPIEVSFHNLFVGTERFFTFENGTDKYTVLFKEKNIGLEPKALLAVKIAESPAEILLSDISNLGRINDKFSDIDLKLFPGDIGILLLKSLFESEIASFTAKIGLDLQLQNVALDEVVPGKYEKEIGVNIARNNGTPITLNLRLNNDLLAILNSKFKKVQATNRELADDFPFEWYLEIGRTILSLEDYQHLEEYDIVFLNDDSSIRSGVYEIKGIGAMRLSGKLDGCNLVVGC